MRRVDYTDDILDYLRRHRGKPIGTFSMITELTRRIKVRNTSRKIRGVLLSDLSRLIRQKKVIRYRKVTMVKRRPRSAQGLVRISEIYA